MALQRQLEQHPIIGVGLCQSKEHARERTRWAEPTVKALSAPRVARRNMTINGLPWRTQRASGMRAHRALTWCVAAAPGVLRSAWWQDRRRVEDYGSAAAVGVALDAWTTGDGGASPPAALTPCPAIGRMGLPRYSEERRWSTAPLAAQGYACRWLAWAPAGPRAWDRGRGRPVYRNGPCSPFGGRCLGHCA